MGRLVTDHHTCSARFRDAAAAARAEHWSHPIAARAPDGAELAIDIARTGATRPAHALVVLAGVHGVEAFAPSEAQADLLGRIGTLPGDVAVVLVHGVNPWGMAHGRRQNESNVDLNRNWARDRRDPPPNDAYDEIHHLACPDTAELPSIDAMLAVLGPIVAERGERWVVDAITCGQYRHPDGLHFGGNRTEASCAILERELAPLLAGVERLLVVDLHTGLGPYGAMTFLSDAPVGSAADRFLGAAFGELHRSDDGVRTEKPGAIARGIAALAPGADACSVVAEVGTTDDLEQLAATYHEHWVHRTGRAGDPAYEPVRRRYRENYTPDDPDWEHTARSGLRDLLDRALGAVVDAR